MPTGSGKTKTTIATLLEHNLKTQFLNQNFIIWLAHSDELCDQAKDSLKNLEIIWNRRSTFNTVKRSKVR